MNNYKSLKDFLESKEKPSLGIGLSETNFSNRTENSPTIKNINWVEYLYKNKKSESEIKEFKSYISELLKKEESFELSFRTSNSRKGTSYTLVIKKIKI